MPIVLKGAGVCLLLAVLIAVVVNLANGNFTVATISANNAVAANPSPTPVPGAINAGMAGIASYPGAAALADTSQLMLSGPNVFGFVTSDSFDQVLAFYRQWFSTNGWDYTESSGPAYKNLVVPDGIAATDPTARSFSERTVELMYNSSRAKGTHFFLYIKIIPDPDHLPLYPDASKIEHRQETDRDISNPADVTTYVTVARPTEVEAFYNKVLPQHGWDAADLPYFPGFSFNYWSGGAEAMTAFAVSITTSVLPDGTTACKLTVH